MDYFFSYGDEKYTQSKLRIKNEALNFGFDKINIYSHEDLDTEFLQKTNPYINSPRGGGYWIWKSFFLKKMFNEMGDGDFCVYADAGCTINPNGKQRYELYKKLICDSGSGILSFRMDGLDEEIYTTEEIFKHFEIESDSEIRLTGQIMATILVLCKNEKSQKLVDEYYNLAITKPNIFSDDFNYLSNSPRFVDNRHDQSILSVMRKKYGSVEIVDETYAGTIEGWNKLYFETRIPFLSTRIRN